MTVLRAFGPLLAVALLAAACGGAGEPADAADEGMAEAPGDPAPDVPCPALLAKADPSQYPLEDWDVRVPWRWHADLRVAATACGLPLAGREVAWTEVEDAKGICELSAAASTTDDAGRAAVELWSRQDEAEGDCAVRACLDGTCLDFRARVQGGPGGLPLVVGFAPYAGAWPGVDTGTVFVHARDAGGFPACADLGPDTDVAAVDRRGPISLLTTVQFMRLPGIEEYSEELKPFTVRCLAAAGTGPARAYGCVDDVQVQFYTRAFVECPLADL